MQGNHDTATESKSFWLADLEANLRRVNKLARTNRRRRTRYDYRVAQFCRFHDTRYWLNGRFVRWLERRGR